MLRIDLQGFWLVIRGRNVPLWTALQSPPCPRLREDKLRQGQAPTGGAAERHPKNGAFSYMRVDPKPHSWGVAM